MGITHRLTSNTLVYDGLPFYSFAHQTIIKTTFCSLHAVFPFNKIRRKSVGFWPGKKRFLSIEQINRTLNLASDSLFYAITNDMESTSDDSHHSIRAHSPAIATQYSTQF